MWNRSGSSKSRRPRAATLAVALLGVLACSAVLSAQTVASRSVLILTADAADVRVSLALEAIEFWNDTLADLRLPLLLGPAEVVTASPAMRTLENHARRVSQRAGRVAPGPREPAPPSELAEMDGDIVLFLSAQKLMPFSWPIADGPRYFIAVSQQRGVVSGSNTTRNVIAHEIGHALGLTHHANPSTLMCLPCESSTMQQEGPVFLPLTAGDRARLVELYSAAAE